MRSHFFQNYEWFLQNLRKDFIRTNMHTTVISLITEKWKGIVIFKKVEGNSNQNGRKFLKLLEKWKVIAIFKLLFPSTPYF